MSVWLPTPSLSHRGRAAATAPMSRLALWTIRSSAERGRCRATALSQRGKGSSDRGSKDSLFDEIAEKVDFVGRDPVDAETRRTCGRLRAFQRRPRQMSWRETSLRIRCRTFSAVSSTNSIRRGAWRHRSYQARSSRNEEEALAPSWQLVERVSKALGRQRKATRGAGAAVALLRPRFRSPCAACPNAAMPESFDEIPIDELLIFDGDELIFDGSDPSTYVVIEPPDERRRIFAALGWSSGTRRGPVTSLPIARSRAMRQERHRRTDAQVRRCAVRVGRWCGRWVQGSMRQ